MVRLTGCLYMTIAVDWDVTPQTKHNQNKTMNVFEAHWNHGLEVNFCNPLKVRQNSLQLHMVITHTL